MCGFRQSTLVTVPLSVICSSPYSAAVEWCAKAAAVKQSPIKTNCKVRSIWIPPELRRDTGLESFCRLKGEALIRRAPCLAGTSYYRYTLTAIVGELF